MHVAFPMIKTPIKYPCSRERLIVAEAAIRFGRAFNSELFDGFPPRMRMPHGFCVPKL
jgi:hypothetical protein